MMPGTHITEEDRRAATTVTTSGSGHKFEIQLGHLCNNRCVFCSSAQLTAMRIARPVPHGLGELQRHGQLVTANICVNERSYRSLPEYPTLRARYGVRQLHVDIVRPESTGERDQDYLREIMPRYSDMAPYYDEMLARFERWDPDFDVNVGNLPYCILPKWGSRIHHGGQETVTKSADAVGLEDAMNKYERHGSLRTYLGGD